MSLPKLKLMVLNRRSEEHTSELQSDPASGNTGTFFIGYSRHWTVTKKMLENMLEQNDYLLTFSDILGGQLFFIPSRPMLDQIADGE